MPQHSPAAFHKLLDQHPALKEIIKGFSALSPWRRGAGSLPEIRGFPLKMCRLCLPETRQHPWGSLGWWRSSSP